MSEIRYHNPEANRERGEEPHHTIDIVIDDELIGRADIEYGSKPIPYYQLSGLYVESEFQQKGYGSKIMDYFEKMLKEKGKAGVLVDAIDPSAPQAKMYEKRGWLPVPPAFKGQYVFNLPKGVSPDIFENYEIRATDLFERAEYRKKIGLD